MARAAQCGRGVFVYFQGPTAKRIKDLSQPAAHDWWTFVRQFHGEEHDRHDEKAATAETVTALSDCELVCKAHPGKKGTAPAAAELQQTAHARNALEVSTSVQVMLTLYTVVMAASWLANMNTTGVLA